MNESSLHFFSTNQISCIPQSVDPSDNWTEHPNDKFNATLFIIKDDHVTKIKLSLFKRIKLLYHLFDDIDDLILIHKGRELNKNHTFMSGGVKNGDTIKILPVNPDKEVKMKCQTNWINMSYVEPGNRFKMCKNDSLQNEYLRLMDVHGLRNVCIERRERRMYNRNESARRAAINRSNILRDQAILPINIDFAQLPEPSTEPLPFLFQVESIENQV